MKMIQVLRILTLFLFVYTGIAYGSSSNNTLILQDSLHIDFNKDKEFLFSNNWYWFQDVEAGLFGIKNESGAVVIEPLFFQIESFRERISIVSTKDSQGAVNDMGDVVIPFHFQELRTSHEGKIAFLQNGKWGF